MPVFSLVKAWAVAPLSTTIVWLAHEGLCINKLFLILLTTFTNPPLPPFQVAGAFWLVLLLPPILLDHVAIFLCSSPGYLHEQLLWVKLRLVPWVWQ